MAWRGEAAKVTGHDGFMMGLMGSYGGFMMGLCLLLLFFFCVHVFFNDFLMITDDGPI